MPKYHAFVPIVVLATTENINAATHQEAKDILIKTLKEDGLPDDIFDDPSEADVQFGRIVIWDENWTALLPDGDKNARTDEEARIADLYNKTVVELSKRILIGDNSLEQTALAILRDAKEKGLRE